MERKHNEKRINKNWKKKIKKVNMKEKGGKKGKKEKRNKTKKNSNKDRNKDNCSFCFDVPTVAQRKKGTCPLAISSLICSEAITFINNSLFEGSFLSK